MNISDLLSEYKKRTNIEPSPQAIRCIEWVAKIGKKFEAVGVGDGLNSKQPLPDEIFKTWAENCFPDDIELQDVCADYIRLCYQNGLEEGRVIV